MSVLGAFESTWSNARSTFGEGSPATGERYDQSSSLRQMQSDLESAAPGSRWTGAAATAYDAANAEHRRVFGELANLDRRLKAHVDASAAAVAAGRSNLDAVRQWVAAAAASLPPGQAGEQMKLAVAQKGISGVIDVLTKSNGDLNAIGENLRGLGAEYEALKDQRFGKGDIAMFAGGGEGERKEDGWKPDNKYEEALHEAGLLDEEPTGYYAEWLQNADRQSVSPGTIVDIAERHDITPEDFEVLNRMEKVTDPDGKSFFLIPKGTSGDDARKAVLMTYILNAGTDYGEGTDRDFEPTPYSADEVQRIIDRQSANSWSYDQDVGFVLDNDGALMTTPNGMLMGMGGNWAQDQFSWLGGTAWGEIFMENIDHSAGAGPAEQLRQIAQSGVSWNVGADGVPRAGTLDLDRLLHHEEIHSQQWAREGYFGMIWDVATDLDRLEDEAGRRDGGYK
ncbi:EspA/EspE family type VII secretion system effector [Mycobacterium deserti]|uniref:ESX-1 secretion-associated protein n=1 Tax=Mycobacterium deserti TaxID=2978347 RepID=A0ABT2M6H7_9MYCO|nr:EspA/EspE family type VII secretion system effector [Mycobacterium deserti]MCT7657863.1 ESX-1 secretion-associated protein [Mycobacterium deserti]